MNWQFFIAKKLKEQKSKRFSSVVMPVAVGSIALALAVTVVSYSIFVGFRRHITDRLFAMSGHITLGKFDLNNSSESLPISVHNALFLNDLQGIDGARKNIFVSKTALLKTEEEVAGVMMKGIDKKSIHVKEKLLVEGDFLNFADTTPAMQILISKHLAEKTSAKIGDELVVFFVQNPPRYRKMKVVGLYSTDIEEFDEYVAYCDIRLLQQINHWQDTLVSGIEISLPDFEQLEECFETVNEELPYDIYAEKITDTHRHFFDWFVMLRRNVLIFMIIILFVACFNVISVLLIMVTERIEMIGILKAMGANNFSVQKIFFYTGIRLIIKGLLLGNLLALGFGYCQSEYKIIPLDPRSYYMSSVPFVFDVEFIAAANICIALLIFLVLFIPVFFIGKISPVKAIKFD